MACEAEQNTLNELAEQLPILQAQANEIASRLNTWFLQMDAAVRALAACQMANQNPPNPPGP
jgi:hypothetical protein